ncbi:MAG: AraC family transcriptional regulator [Phycisphaerae bacterium]|jgi:AraC-like DNA-binding protein|nr:AraC family transcriptional regulator [Phycisphaerae bacterium]
MSERYIHTISKAIIRYPPGSTYGPRINGNYEFIWIIRGTCRIEIEGKNYNAPPNSVFLLQPEQHIFFEWDPKETTIQGFIHFNLLQEIPGLGPVSLWPTQLILDEDDDILMPLLKYIAGIREQGDEAARILIESGMLQAVITFVKRWTRFGTVALSNRNPTLSDLYRTIHGMLENMNSPVIHLETLAKKVNVTPEYLCRLTRKGLNMTPMELVYRLRTEKAAKLLSRTDLPVKKIAELCGFKNVYHFSRRFRTLTGSPPAKYRSLANQGKVVPSSIYEVSNPIQR